MSSGQEVGEIFGAGTGLATALLRSPTVIIASIALWGMNIYFFKLFGIDYVRVLNGGKLPPSSTPPPRLAVSPSDDVTDDDDLDQTTTDGPSTATTTVEAAATIQPPSHQQQELSQTSSGRHQHGKSNTTTTPQSTGDALPTSSLLHPPSGAEITSSKCLLLSLLLFSLLHLTSHVWINLLRGGTIGAIFAFYVIAGVGVALPLDSTQWMRIAIGTVIFRALELVNPRCSCVRGKSVPVPFVDVFFADAMCSLSKVFFDWGLLWLCASYYPYPVPATTHSIIIPSLFAAFPYLIRARQCLVMYNIGRVKGDPKHYQHMLNAIKYSTSLFPICVSAYQKIDVEKKEKMEYFLVILLTVNSLYSYAWDVIMDWGMMSNPTQVIAESCVPKLQQPSSTNNERKKEGAFVKACLRPRLRFGLGLSMAIILADAVLRFSWTLRFYEHFIFPSNDLYILCTELLEAFRRGIWNLLRVEWENIKQMASGSESKGKDEEERVPFLKKSSLQMVNMSSNGTTTSRQPPK